MYCRIILASVAVAVQCVAFSAEKEPVKAVPQTRIEKAMAAVASRYSESELREIKGFFAPVVKKWTPTAEKFAREYMKAADKNAVIRKFLPQARLAIDDARKMSVPPKYVDRRDKYVMAAEALYSTVGIYLRFENGEGR